MFIRMVGFSRYRIQLTQADLEQNIDIHSPEQTGLPAHVEVP
jgi:hypothetical protein